MRTDVVLHYHFVTLRLIADLSEPYSLGSMIKSMQDPAPNSAVLVGLGGLEPPTSRLSGVRSNHLSYRPWECVLLSPERSDTRTPTDELVELDGFEPTTPCVQSRCSPN